MELVAWLCGQCECKVTLSTTALIVVLVMMTSIWFLVDGFCVNGFLKRSVTIKLTHIGTNIHIHIGDVLSQEGCAIVPANDFFDNVVNEDLVTAKSIDGQMIQRFWGGNIASMDAEVSRQLQSEKYALVERTAPAKSKRYKIGTSVLLRVTDKLRIIWIALTTTDVATNKTHAELEDLTLATREAPVKAHNKGNGDVLNIPLLGGGLSRTGMGSSFLLNQLFGIIVDESKRQNITGTINIILTKSAMADINLLEMKKTWEA